MEEVHCIIAVNITNFAPDGGLFLVTGTVDIADQGNRAAAAEERDAGRGSGHEPDGRDAGCDGGILVEERGMALRGMIQREHESIAALGMLMVGYVVL